MSHDPTPSPPEEPRSPRPGALGVTTAQQIVISALSGVALGYLILVTIQVAGGTPPLVPWSLPIVFGLVSVAVWWYTRLLVARLEKRIVPPDESVRAAVLGKSMLMVGAALAGGHLVYVFFSLNQLDVQGPRDRVIHGSVMVVTSVVFAAVGYLLERACVVDLTDGEGGEGQPA